jgi:hypothetical protein
METQLASEVLECMRGPVVLVVVLFVVGLGIILAVKLMGSPRARVGTAKQFIDQIAPSLGPGFSYVNVSDAGWQGTVRGLPLMIECDSSGRVKLTLKLDCTRDRISLRCDASKVPQPGAPPPCDSFGTPLIFVGKGVYFDNVWCEVSQQLERFQALPPGADRSDGSRRRPHMRHQ